MLHKGPYLRLFFILLVSYFLQTTCQDAYSVVVPISFSGGSPICPNTDCTERGSFPMPSFACDTSPTWDNGTSSFQDPLGDGFMMTSILVTVAGVFGCDKYFHGMQPVEVYFAGVYLSFLQVSATMNCTCRNCATTWHVTAYVSGWPSYQFNENNTIQVFQSGLSICVSSIDLVITYVHDAITSSSSSTSLSSTSTLTSTSATATTTTTTTTTATTVIPSSTLTSTGTTTTNATNSHDDHKIEIIGISMLSVMIFVNVFLIGGCYILRRKRGTADPEFDDKVARAPLLDKQLHYKDIQIGDILGKGSFAEVFSAKWFATQVAVKIITIENPIALQEYDKEISLLKTLRHPNILQILDSCMVPSKIYIITELMPRGDLHRIINDDSVALDKPLMKKLLIDISRGINYLHSSNPVVLHRDLKSHNVLIGEHWNAKVADFGVGKITQRWEQFGIPKWVAPEVLQARSYTTKADVYSFAIIMWEMTTRLEPYPDIGASELMTQVSDHGLRPGTVAESNPLRNLIISCWDDNPKQRPSFERILSILEAW